MSEAAFSERLWFWTTGQQPIKNNINYYYYFHVTLIQKEVRGFEVTLHSTCGWRSANFNTPQNWTYRRIFETLEQAQAQIQDILCRPKQYADPNKPQNDYYINTYWRYLPEDGKKVEIKSRYERPTGLDDGSLANAVAAGEKIELHELANAELMRQLWGRPEPAARAALSSFATLAHFVYGVWAHWKWLYKQAETSQDNDLLAAFLARINEIELRVEDRDKADWSPLFPAVASRDTLTYLKRRGRRLLKQMAVSNPARYVEIAAEILSETPGSYADDLFKYQWITADILYGGSGRYIQIGHGRGGYFQARKRPSLVIADERVPEAWSSRSDLLTEIYSDSNLPWQISEWAWLMLRRRNLPIPQELPAQSYLAFLRGQSPILVRIAREYLASRINERGNFDPEAIARAFWLSNGRQRRELSEALAMHGGLKDWDKQFAQHLSDLLGAVRSSNRLTRRQFDAAVLLGSSYLSAVPHDKMLNILPALFAADPARFQALAQGVLNKLELGELENLLSRVSGMSRELREGFLTMVVLGLNQNKKAINAYQLRQLLTNTRNELAAQVGWQILAGWPEVELVREVWQNLLNRPGLPALTFALKSPVAFTRLLGLPDLIEQFRTLLTTRPDLLTLLSREVLAVMVRQTNFELLLKLVELMSAEQWHGIKGYILDNLQQDGRMGGFWLAALQTIAVNPESVLAQRLLNQPEVAATFQTVSDPQVLELTEPVFGPLLVSWMEQHLDQFGQGSPTLLRAAMSKLPAVRFWALERLNTVGLTLPVALRLLESGLPDSIASGRQFFEALPAGNSQELEYALAICDSPDKSVQAYGREYVNARWTNLPAPELLRRLSEHPDPPIQELVVKHLDQAGEQNQAEYQQFKRHVMRARDRGRRVKEAVKQQIEQAPQTGLDTATLIELARSRTPRDAEWAWQQLAKLALAGQPVEGLEIEGVEGI